MVFLALIQLYLIIGIAVMLIVAPIANAENTCSLDILALIGLWPIVPLVFIILCVMAFYYAYTDY